MEDETHGYHFFLMPPEETRESLRALVRQLSHTYGGPIFEPHITMLPEIPMTEGDLIPIGADAVNAAPLVSFDGVRTGTAFFKCLYLSIKCTDALRALNAALALATGIERAFDPHISLAYGHFDAETLARMKSDAESYVAEHPLADGAASALELWKTEGKADAWKQAAPIPFRT